MSEDRTQQLPDDGVRQILALLQATNARLDSMDARFDTMEARLNSMDARLTALEEKVDRRLQETRPIWEQVLSRLTAIEKRLDKIEFSVSNLNLKFRAFNADLLEIQNKHDDLEERVRRLEPEPSK